MRTKVHPSTMDGQIVGFDWDRGNRKKCWKHGVSVDEIEGLFMQPVMILPDTAHSLTENRFRAVGKTPSGRHVFVVFTIREKEGKEYIRPVSARYMHKTEIEHYEKENPDL